MQTAAVALLPFAASGSCHAPAAHQVAAPTMPPPGPTDAIHAAAVRGAWRWSHVAENDGVRRVELESWWLQLDGTKVSGHYDRTVTFLSLDGVPFECSQALTYSLRTRYRLAGSADATHLEIDETGYDTVPSPCEGGYRKRAHYAGFLQGKQLVLRWPRGSQALRRAERHDDPPPPAASQLDGRWVWHNSSGPDVDDEIRVEREDWELSESPSGRIAGSYLRTVTVYDAEGRIMPCSGQSWYTYSDRYTVAGSRRRGRLILSEVAVAPQPHPCLADRQERHLDAAVGRVDGDYIELTWRGSHLQILHRPQG